jgi:hypothetical protein
MSLFIAPSPVVKPIITLSSLASKAANANLVEALKYE